MSKIEGAQPRRFVGNLSPMGFARGMVSLDPAEGAKGNAAVVEVAKGDLNKADDLKKAVADLIDATNTLAKREKSGRVVTEDEWKNVDDGLKELAGRLKASEETLRANSEFLSKGGESFLIDKALLRLETPDSMQRAQRPYFNVVALSFEELAGLAQMGRASQRYVGMSGQVAQAYSSPGASRLRETQARLQYLNDVMMVKDVLMSPTENRSERYDLVRAWSGSSATRSGASTRSASPSSIARSTRARRPRASTGCRSCCRRR
jgi:hypothetical protein